MTEGFEFLGFRFIMHWDKRYGYGPRIEIPKAKAANLRRKVKARTGTSSTPCSLASKLQELNPILRGGELLPPLQLMPVGCSPVSTGTSA